MTEIQKAMPMMDTGLIGMHGRSQCSGTLMPAFDYMHFVLLYGELCGWGGGGGGEMNQILCCDWLPERASCSYLARSGLPTMSLTKNFCKSQIISALSTKLGQSRWLDIGLILFLHIYGP